MESGLRYSGIQGLRFPRIRGPVLAVSIYGLYDLGEGGISRNIIVGL